MLKIINDLKPFFEECYREWGVREYARAMKITAPTASKLLKGFEKEGLLSIREERGFLLFKADRGSKVLMDLSRIYWRGRLKKLVEHIKEVVHPDSIVLFGSLAKLEVSDRSDIDLAVFGGFKKEISAKEFEKKLKKEIQIFAFDSIEKVNKELRANIRRGIVLEGVLR